MCGDANNFFHNFLLSHCIVASIQRYRSPSAEAHLHILLTAKLLTVVEVLSASAEGGGDLRVQVQSGVSAQPAQSQRLSPLPLQQVPQRRHVETRCVTAAVLL